MGERRQHRGAAAPADPALTKKRVASARSDKMLEMDRKLDLILDGMNEVSRMHWALIPGPAPTCNPHAQCRFTGHRRSYL